MNFCFFHRYKELGEQQSTFVRINYVPITRMVLKCKKCGDIQYRYNFLGVEENDITRWTPVIDTSETLSEIRQKKLKKLKKL